MNIAPKKIKIIGSLAAVSAVGAVFTLTHQSSPKAASYQAHSTSAEVTPTVTDQTPSVSVNGTEVPLKNGTTTVDTGSGKATVSVSGNSATVNATSNQQAPAANPASGVSIDVQSSSSGNGNSSTSSYQHTSSNSSSSVHSSSTVNVSSQGGGHVEVQTH